MAKTIKELNEEIAALKKENEELKNEIKMLSNVCIDRARLLGDQAATINALRYTARDYKAELETREMERDVYKRSIDRIEAFIKEDTNIPYSIIEHVRGKELTAAKKEYYQWFKKITHSEENETLADMRKQCDALNQLCRDLGNQNDEAQKTINEQADEIAVLKKDRENDICTLKCDLDHAYSCINSLEHFFAKEHGYTWEDFESIKKIGRAFPRHTFAMDSKFENDILKGKNKELIKLYENLKAFIRRSCVVVADIDKMKAALEAEDWSKASDLVHNYLRIHAEAENANKDEQHKKLEVRYDILQSKNRELIDKNRELHNENEKLKETEAAYEVLKSTNIRLINGTINLRKEIDSLNESNEFWRKRACDHYEKLEDAKSCLNKIYGAGEDCDSEYPKLYWEHTGTPLIRWDPRFNSYTCHLNGVKILVADDGTVTITKE